ncbi:MAG: thiosulfate oxidation carrier complex protein SoxZ [Rhodobacteraceae bacterium]|nr:thiosulfate oxidation carrier complex protein SoxZ [Paracoccaceae bacterium]
MAEFRIRKSVPETVRKGEVFEIKTLVTHPMDNGFMFGRDGKRIPRHIIHRFEAIYNGKTVFGADWHVAVSTNPYISFHALAEESGTIEFRWHDDNGTVHVDSVYIQVI